MSTKPQSGKESVATMKKSKHFNYIPEHTGINLTASAREGVGDISTA